MDQGIPGSTGFCGTCLITELRFIPKPVAGASAPKTAVRPSYLPLPIQAPDPFGITQEYDPGIIIDFVYQAKIEASILLHAGKLEFAVKGFKIVDAGL